jgi:hypothetical protein
MAALFVCQSHSRPAKPVRVVANSFLAFAGMTGANAQVVRVKAEPIFAVAQVVRAVAKPIRVEAMPVLA